MSRSGYSDDLDNWAMIKWRGRVASATRGRRGQQLLKDLLAALDAMSVKELVAEEFQYDGQFCALGVVAQARGLDPKDFDPDDEGYGIAPKLDIAQCLAQEIMFENDQDWWGRLETPAQRWHRVRFWVEGQIIPAPGAD